MKITKKQYDSFNAKCFNGYKMDLQHAVVWGEKEPFLNIDVGDGNVLRVKIQFNWHNQIEVHTQLWSPGSTPGVYVSSGMGDKLHNYGGVHMRKMSAELCKLTKDWPAEKVVEEYNKLNPNSPVQINAVDPE